MLNTPLLIRASTIGVGVINVRDCILQGRPTQGRCPAQGAHDHTGSGDYSLEQV